MKFKHNKWTRRLIVLVTHNWREKLLALALASLFWYLVRSQAAVHRGYFDRLPNAIPRGQL